MLKIYSGYHLTNKTENITFNIHELQPQKEVIEIVTNFVLTSRGLEDETLDIGISTNNPLVNRSKILNLKVISKSDEFNDFYISVMNDKTTDTFIIFYYMYRKYFTNFASYKEISIKDDLYGTILSLLKDNEADPEAISEKVIFE